MGTRDDEFLKRLLAAFRIEADEHLRAIANGLVEMEKELGPAEQTTLIETMYRDAHSLKGASRSVNMVQVESICQVVEGVFAAWKAGRITPSTEMFDTLHYAVDIMTELLEGAEGVDIQPLLENLARLEKGVASTPPRPRRVREASVSPEAPEAPPVVSRAAAPVPSEAPGRDVLQEPAEPPDAAEIGPSALRLERALQTETVRIAVSKLDPLLRQVSEMVSVKLTAAQRITELNQVIATIEQWKQKWTSLTSQGKGISGLVGKSMHQGSKTPENGRLAKVMEFLEWNQAYMKTLEAKLIELTKSAQISARMRDSLVDGLLEGMMNVLMLPCSSLLEFLPKLVRDLARDAGKEVKLEIRGGDLEIDRRILDEMKDPLIHLLRNSIDHGIELPEERERIGKPRHGTIIVAFSQITGNQVELLVSDDGAGIDVVRVREAARKRGLIPDQEKARIDSQDAVSLVFRSEVSTSPIVSNLSGRGLGLAIVREKVENLGGNIAVATAPQLGVSFRLLLPVTLSTFRGILVHSSDQLFILPTSSVERVARIKKNSIRTVGNQETIEVNGRTISVVNLADILGLAKTSKKGEDSEFISVLILRSTEAVVGFRVDMILQEQEVLVKSLGKQLSRVRNVAGATVLGSGKLAPILHVPDLVKSAVRGAAAVLGTALPAGETEAFGAKQVLIVEDSITSRMLLKNILESSGYAVTTSVDGSDAWSLLKQERFDLVVSDVEMPRMDGFTLTANIRSDDRLSHLPVVLVTSLGSREDRERGIEVGANAYIVKGSFDQNNLLETVERLV